MDLMGNMYEVFPTNHINAYEYLPRQDNWRKWSERKFFQRFRLTKPTVNFVLRKLYDQIKPRVPRMRAHDLTARDKLLLTLRFFATGNILQSAGDFTGVSTMTASRVVREVSIALSKLRPEFIKFPRSREEITNICAEFYKTARFPRCCGAIDCTHVRIQRPVGEIGEIYRNRKGYFSLNVQTISDNNLKFLNIVARWPGSTHDCTIFNNSRVKATLESDDFTNFHIIGDKGYALKKYCLTPLSDPFTEGETLYNESIIRTRNVVERKYGVLKRRFPVLALGIALKLDTIQAIIVACAILHNIARDANENLPIVPAHIRAEVEDDINMNVNINTQLQREATTNVRMRTELDRAKYYRRNIIANYFSNL